MKEIFTAEDFTFSYAQPHTLSEMQLSLVTDSANRKISQLIESWPVVFSRGNDSTSAWWPQHPGRDITVKARLAFIEEIKPCNHEPDHTKFMNQIDVYTSTCKKCGAKLKPTKWEVLGE